MRFQAHSWRLRGEPLEPKPHLSVWLAYEDALTHQRAQQFVQWLGERFGKQFQVESKSWELTELQTSELLEMARMEVRGAEMMVLSLHNEGSLAPATQQTLEELFTDNGLGDCALVALLDEGDGASPPIIPARLRQLAAVHGVTFFWRRGTPRRDDVLPEAAGDKPDRGESHDETERLQTPVEARTRWGINE